MKQEKAAAAEEIEARKSSEVGEHDENITNHGENSGNQEEWKDKYNAINFNYINEKKKLNL